ncbi:MAG: 8-oxoguanine DNA glycosylase [Clostridiales Family XIII bacterium]|jgi:N-glycosylase/DNA lyase|nr:8-oxoguanine DNA glycosylase [Clostridiales Family XIII bacterium]
MDIIPRSERLFKHIIYGIRDFDLEETFLCGQCFRWVLEDDGSYSCILSGGFANVRLVDEWDAELSLEELNAKYNLEIVVGGKDAGSDENAANVAAIAVSTEDSTPIIDITPRIVNPKALIIWSNLFSSASSLVDDFWRDYFDLNRDYGAIKDDLIAESAFMETAIKSGSGIRILNQDKWETLISFIISQNNNIPRIKSCIENLCREFGEYLGKFNGRELYAFPGWDVLSEIDEDDLKPIKLGYRAKYIIETAKRIAYDNGTTLSAGDKMNTADIEQYLRSLPGVGPKVAHCIMLFSMRQTHIFPIDVWMRRAMNQAFDIDEDDVLAMHRYAKEHFGANGGIAQQYLFFHFREL